MTEILQGTQEWLAARTGRITFPAASRSNAPGASSLGGGPGIFSSAMASPSGAGCASTGKYRA